MFCKNCGQQIKDGAAFCGNCGTPVSMQTAIGGESGKKQSNRKGKIIICAAVILAALIGTGVALGLSSDSYQCRKNMKLAQKSSQTGEYEKAVFYYKKALEIDSLYVDAYLELADLYFEEEEFDNALEILDKGTEKKNLSLEEKEELLDKTNEGYLKKANSFLKRNDLEQAAEILKEGQEVTGDHKGAILAKQMELYLETFKTLKRDFWFTASY